MHAERFGSNHVSSFLEVTDGLLAQWSMMTEWKRDVQFAFETEIIASHLPQLDFQFLNEGSIDELDSIHIFVLQKTGLLSDSLFSNRFSEGTPKIARKSGTISLSRYYTQET